MNLGATGVRSSCKYTHTTTDWDTPTLRVSKLQPALNLFMKFEIWRKIRKFWPQKFHLKKSYAMKYKHMNKIPESNFESDI